MPVTELFLVQIADPFRIVLAIGLVLTTYRTRAATGFWLPLGLGVLFISVLIPLTIGAGAVEPGGVPLTGAILMGLASTAVIVAAVVLVRALVLRASGR